MANQIDSNKNSKILFESQSLILNLNENVKKFPSQQNIYSREQYIDDIDHQIYKNTIKFTAAIPQVNKKTVVKKIRECHTRYYNGNGPCENHVLKWFK